ncbi:MAG TPA: FliI/YscN family ATPase [Gammaproteobacteria bacterium]|nr:FliI/YscN family ATPase [Gammaproteobacteria bacterium]
MLRRMAGMTLEADGCEAPVGSRCVVVDGDGSTTETEVVGFSGGSLLLVATDEIGDVTPGARVIPGGKVFEAYAGPGLLGRVIDGAGQPLDGLGPLRCEDRIRLTPRPMNPLDRKPIREPLDVGVRSINALLTVGRGQRLGLFAGSGVGKSVLLGMMTRFTTADVIVVGLIGERGREVQDFVSQYLTPQTRKRAVIIATPADRPPLVRIHSALLATSIAEYFRDQGKNVLLLMDSLTRVSQAQREIALAIGEPPVTKGYPVSVFAKLPQLVERAGNGGPRGGSITAFYTVLTEGDDPNDPVADAARAVLDGHIVLSRQIAETGLYPAIDIEASISRLMPLITTPEQQQLIRRFRAMNAAYAQNRDLITIGAYAKGSDPRVDEAIHYWPAIQRFLQQDGNESISFAQSFAALQALFSAERPREVKK